MAIEEQTVDTSLEEITVPEDASSDSFLDDAYKAVMEEAGLSDQLKVDSEEEVKTEDSTPSPDEEDAGESEDELDKPFVGSRREAYRLAEERGKKLQEATQKTAELEAQLQQQAKDDADLAREVESALATEEDYRQLNLRARAGDKQAGLLLNQVDANRKFFGKLQAKASRDITNYFTAELISKAKEAGLPEELIYKGTPAEIVKSAYTAGLEKANAEAKVQLESMEAELKQAKSTRVTSKARVLSGGSTETKDTVSDMFGPDGLLTDDAVEMMKSGRLRGI